MSLSMVTFTEQSLERLKNYLITLAPRARERFVLKALRKGGKVVQQVAATPGIVPVLAKPIYRRGRMIRQPGTLQRNITVRRSKDAAARGDVGVFVNVRPAKGGLRGAESPVDPFYWRFVQFGTKHMKARPFLTIGARELPGRALDEIKRSLEVDFQQERLPGV